MNKAEMIEKAAEKSGLSKKDAAAATAALLEVIAEELEKGEGVQLKGFGSFSVRDRAARQGRSLRTGKTVEIPATKAATFKQGKELKGRLNKS